MLQQLERERIRSMIKDTITLLCRNSLNFKSRFSIEAVIGVTLDDEEVFLVSMNEIIESDTAKDDCSHTGSSDVELVTDSGKRCRKRARVKNEPRIVAQDEDDSSRDTHVSLSAADDHSVVDGHFIANAQGCIKMENENSDDDSNDILFVKEEVSWLDETLPNKNTDSKADQEYTMSQSEDCDPANQISSASLTTSVTKSNQSYYRQQDRRTSIPHNMSEHQSSLITDTQQMNSSLNMVSIR